MREIRFTPDAWDAYVGWQGQGNLAGLWSRRIDEMHRLVYEANELAVTIVACRFHYDD